MTVPEALSKALLGGAQRRRAAGDAAGALVLLDELLQRDPHCEPAARLMVALLLPGDPPRAAVMAQRMLAVMPRDAELIGLMGQALSALGRTQDAVLAFRDAVSVEPTSCAAHLNLSVALLRTGQAGPALEAAERARGLPPVLPEAHAAAGHARNALREHAAALDCFRAALALRPAYPDALIGVARACRGLGQAAAATVALLRAAEASPGAVEPVMDLVGAYQDIGDIEAAREALDQGRRQHPHAVDLAGNALMHAQYDPTIPEETATAEARAWGLRQVLANRPVDGPRPARGDRLRVGYVSADLGRHPVGWLGAGAIAAHDRHVVSVTIYANQAVSDPLTETLRRSVDAWVPILGLDDESVARRIVADGIDVLVDLSGHTGGNRLGVFARRPAPVQASWLGYVATTGLPTMDAVLFDAEHCPPGAEQDFTERLIRLPRIRFAYTPPAEAPAVAPPPCLAAGAVTFGSFNNLAKLNDAVIAAWSEILLQVPGSGLLLKWRSLGDRFVQDRLRARFARHGVAPERLAFEGLSPHVEALARYAAVDIALDPFPFCGGMTTVEALWMGVPVVTLPGRRTASRQSHAILAAIGEAGWSAASTADLVSIARRLAGDRDGLARIRSGLRDRVRASALCDPPGLARALEACYRALGEGSLAGPGCGPFGLRNSAPA